MCLAGTLEQLEQQQLQQDPVMLQRQRVACDAMMCLLELPVQLAYARRLLLTALSGSSAAGLAWPYRLLGAAGVLVYLMGTILHLVYLVMQPAAALQRRRILWPVRVCLAPALLRVVQAVLRVQASWPARRGLLVLSSCLGLLDMPVLVLAAWLPLMAVVYFAVHAWTLWQVRSWALLAFDAVEFNLFPLICYAFTRAAVVLMQQGLDAALPRLQGLVRAGVGAMDGQRRHHDHQHSRLRRSSRLVAEHPQHQHQQQQQQQQQQLLEQQGQPWRSWLEGALVVTAAAGSQLVVSGVLMWVLLRGPLQLPSSHDPWAALESTKAVLGSMLERMGLHILTQTVRKHPGEGVGASNTYSWRRCSTLLSNCSAAHEPLYLNQMAVFVLCSPHCFFLPCARAEPGDGAAAAGPDGHHAVLPGSVWPASAGAVCCSLARPAAQRVPSRQGTGDAAGPWAGSLSLSPPCMTLLAWAAAVC
jgi:hypothetical protein